MRSLTVITLHSLTFKFTFHTLCQLFLANKAATLEMGTVSISLTYNKHINDTEIDPRGTRGLLQVIEMSYFLNNLLLVQLVK